MKKNEIIIEEILKDFKDLSYKYDHWITQSVEVKGNKELEDKYTKYALRTLTQLNTLENLINNLRKRGFSIEIQ